MTTLKKCEITFGLIALIALILNVLKIPVGMFALVSFSLLALFYMNLGLAIFNNIQLRGMLIHSSYKGLSAMRIIGSIGTGIALSITVMGLLFNILSWPGATVQLSIGLILLGIILCVLLFRYSKNTSDFFHSVVKRIVIYGGVGLLYLFMQ